MPKAEAAPHEVPRLDAETSQASTPADMSSASGIAETCSRQLWMRVLKVFTPRLSVLRLLVVVALHVWPAAASAALSTSVRLLALCTAIGLHEDASLMEGGR